ncbi:DUF3027 domain-containing protein [Dermacoccaceae bacterium W4C1]
MSAAAVEDRPAATRAIKADRALLGDDAAALAKAEAEAIAEPGRVGDLVSSTMLGERLAEHAFACLHPGYVGWFWTVSVARAPRQRAATVCETNLLPGPDAVLAPEWVPYDQRLRPGDLRPGDATALQEVDPNLEAGWEATGEEDVDQVALDELGLGRPRVLSAEGREAAAQRWYDGDHGPGSEHAKQAAAHCASCGYFVPMAGVLRQVFGVCASEWSPDDGSVVSLDHGCGAHSETDVEKVESEKIDPPVLDEFALDTSS